MRTKKLLVMAALSVAAVTSWAQVYSVNAVGYVNVTIPADGVQLALLANPLNGTNNLLSTILPLTDDNFLTTVYLWDTTAQNYSISVWFTASGGGWQPDLVAPPGQGFFILGVSSSGTMSITFVGEVPQGHLVNTLQAGPNISLNSSIVPQQGTLDQLGFPGEFLDTVYLWDVDGSIAGTPQNYVPLVNFGGPGTWDPNYAIKVAQGFFVAKAPDNTGLEWARDFSVNNP